MDYQVWTKDEVYDKWDKVDCGDLGAVKRELDKAIRTGQKPLLTIEVPYELAIRVGEVDKETPKTARHKKEPETAEKEVTEVEATEAKAQHNQGPGAEGYGQV